MVAYLLSGDDFSAVRERRNELLAASGAIDGAVQRFDLTDPAEATRFGDALDTRPLFGGARYLEARFDTVLPDQLIAKVASASAGQDTIVLHTAGKPRTSLTEALNVSAEHYPLPQAGRGLENAIRAAATQHQVDLSPPQAARIAQVCAGDPARALSLVYTLSVRGSHTPTETELESHLAFGIPPAGAPWALVDHLAAGRLGTALTIADALEPLQVWTMVASKLGQIGRVVDSRYATAEDAAAGLGIASFTVAATVHQLAGRLGPAGMAASWQHVMASDIAIKQAADPRAALDAALAKLHLIWQPPAD